MTDAIEIQEAKDKGEDYGQSAEYYSSTYVNGFDIYLHDTIPQQDRKKILFHEVLEANLRRQGFSQVQAHGITVVEEENIFGKREK